MSVEKIQAKTLSDIPSKFPLIQGKEMGKVCFIDVPFCAMRVRGRSIIRKYNVGNTNKSQKISFSASTETHDFSANLLSNQHSSFLLYPRISRCTFTSSELDPMVSSAPAARWR